MAYKQLQRKEHVVVVTDNPPEIRAAQVTMGDQVYPVTLDHGVENVIRPGGCIDALSGSDELLVAIDIQHVSTSARMCTTHGRVMCTT